MEGREILRPIVAFKSCVLTNSINYTYPISGHGAQLRLIVIFVPLINN